jgi:tRNA1(Val) A37 N6-methylase TrmN6
MSFTPEETTVDGFLGGRLQIRQPMTGYRAATDPVFLAAAVCAKKGQSVLELGCGVGVASLCLAARVPGIAISGLEVQPDYAALALANGRDNNMPFAVFEGDLRAMPAELRAQSFDHVMMNPPFFDQGMVVAPENAGKSVAHVDGLGMEVWLEAGLRRLRPGGTLTVIQLVAQLPAILAGLSGAGDIRVLPIAPRAGRAAKRVIVRAQKGAKGALKLLPPFCVHSRDAHVQGQADYGPLAGAILRSGAAVDWE